MKWAYGVTTVASRKNTTLARTLHSLCDAGFGCPRLFVDDCTDAAEYDVFGREVTCRSPAMGVFGNWLLSAMELYLRDRDADFYAIFQDDLVSVENLREYLESCRYPKKGYWNLYTSDNNLTRAKKTDGWHASAQKGHGALGLVFNNEALLTLLADSRVLTKPSRSSKALAWRSMDGSIVTVMQRYRICEYVHTPSLLQHTGVESSIGHKRFPRVSTFPGEEFDANCLRGDDCR